MRIMMKRQYMISFKCSLVLLFVFVGCSRSKSEPDVQVSSTLQDNLNQEHKTLQKTQETFHSMMKMSCDLHWKKWLARYAGRTPYESFQKTALQPLDERIAEKLLKSPVESDDFQKFFSSVSSLSRQDHTDSDLTQDSVPESTGMWQGSDSKSPGKLIIFFANDSVVLDYFLDPTKAPSVLEKNVIYATDARVDFAKLQEEHVQNLQKNLIRLLEMKIKLTDDLALIASYSSLPQADLTDVESLKESAKKALENIDAEIAQAQAKLQFSESSSQNEFFQRLSEKYYFKIGHHRLLKPEAAWNLNRIFPRTAWNSDSVAHLPIIVVSDIEEASHRAFSEAFLPANCLESLGIEKVDFIYLTSPRARASGEDSLIPPNALHWMRKMGEYENSGITVQMLEL